MGFLSSSGGLIGSIIAAIVRLVFAILSFFLTIFIVQAGASMAGYAPSGEFVTLTAALLSLAAIVAGASPMSGVGDGE